MNILQVIRAGYVTRYHATPEIPPETVGQHHAATAALCLWLTDGKASAGLLSAAVLHDAAEIVTGDTPGPAKRRIRGLAALMERAADEADAEMGITWLMRLDAANDAATLALADKLAAVLHVRQTRPDLLATDEWRREAQACVRMAWGIGPDMAAKVEGLVG